MQTNTARTDTNGSRRTVRRGGSWARGVTAWVVGWLILGGSPFRAEMPPAAAAPPPRRDPREDRAKSRPTRQADPHAETIRIYTRAIESKGTSWADLIDAYYIAQHYLLKGQRAPAVTNLKRCLATGQTTFGEYSLAKSDLARLTKQNAGR